MSDNGSQVMQASANEAVNRPISLIDATKSREESTDDTRRASPSPSWRQLAKRPTKESVREGLARWKYSKWQQARYDTTADQEPPGESAGEASVACTANSQALQQEGTRIDTSDFALRAESQERGRQRVKKTKDRTLKKKDEKQPYDIDVLYENQRGWFFFGIPLYSHSSLLNFDPSPWTTKDAKDSAVNITNAQPPDPSWEWAWKSWYVDMSYDVDEEGWQYSFSFSRKFSWHGTHPWFHCFVRRRRWLRKRVKRQEMKMKDASDMGAAHTLTADYFTIHTKRGRSPGSGLESATQRSSYMSRGTAEERDLPPEDIKNIPSLFKALRLATIDREKIDAVKRFVETGGEELVYLEEHIPEIMGFLVFQASRRRLLEYLQIVANKASKERPKDKAEERRVTDLRKAVRVATGSQIGGLEYWSDRQQVLKTVNGNKRGHHPMFSHSSAMSVPKDDDPVDEIRGIPEDVGVGVNLNKRVFSTLPENRVGLSNVDGQSEQPEEAEKTEAAEKEDREDKGSSGAQTPKSIPRDSLKVDD